MQGSVISFLPEKGYGFIKGDDGKEYFFHRDEFLDHSIINQLCDGSRVSFDAVPTSKGYKAKCCKLISEEFSHKFLLPNNVFVSKNEAIPGWQVIEVGDWVVTGSSRESPEGANEDAKYKAILLGGNALLNTKYFKTTGEEQGTGNGVYRFTIHNTQGRIATIAKPSIEGTRSHEEIIGLNQRAESYNEEVRELAGKNEKIRKFAWLVGGGVCVVSFLNWEHIRKDNYLFLGLAIFGVLLGILIHIYSQPDSRWMKYSPITDDVQGR